MFCGKNLLDRNHMRQSPEMGVCIRNNVIGEKRARWERKVMKSEARPGPGDHKVFRLMERILEGFEQQKSLI